MPRKWYSIDDEPLTETYHAYTGQPYVDDSDEPFLRVHYGSPPVSDYVKRLFFR